MGCTFCHLMPVQSVTPKDLRELDGTCKGEKAEMLVNYKHFLISTSPLGYFEWQVINSKHLFQVLFCTLKTEVVDTAE